MKAGCIWGGQATQMTNVLRYSASSGRLLFAIVAAASVVALPSISLAYDLCDNQIDVENGEKPGGPLFGVGYAMIAYALAEKYCGAAPISMAPKILGYVQEHGCGPDTPIYSELKEAIAKLEAADLEFMAADGDPNLQLSPADVQEWARSAAEGLGGCSALVAAHDQELR